MNRRDLPSWLLAAGALAGAAVAAVGIAGGGGRAGVPDDAVAVVDGVAIRAADYRRAVEAVAADRRDGAIDDELRRRVLERLIDEELLVQRGVELRLAERDTQVRNYLSAAVIDLIVARADDDAADPDELALRALYAADPAFFAPPPRLRVQCAFFRDEASARTAAERLAAGDGFAAVVASSDPAPAPVPDALLPPAKLREYVGPTVESALRDLASGAVSGPIRTAGGYYVARVVERSAPEAPAFELVREQVRAEYRRRAGDEALRRFLDERRADATIAVIEERL